MSFVVSHCSHFPCHLHHVDHLTQLCWSCRQPPPSPGPLTLLGLVYTSWDPDRHCDDTDDDGDDGGDGDDGDGDDNDHHDHEDDDE